MSPLEREGIKAALGELKVCRGCGADLDENTYQCETCHDRHRRYADRGCTSRMHRTQVLL